MPAIYHITHVENLRSILGCGFLQCKNECGRSQSVSIAHESIQQRRAARRVPCGPGGVVHDYVPFYFAPRSPMLYSINRGNVEGYAGDQSSVVHLVSSTEEVINRGHRFVFTDGNAGTVISEFFEDLADLRKVDWSVMQAQYWNATTEDPDRARRRQAEFLIHRELPIEALHYIGVYNDRVRGNVANCLADLGLGIQCGIKKNWYY